MSKKRRRSLETHLQRLETPALLKLAVRKKTIGSWSTKIFGTSHLKLSLHHRITESLCMMTSGMTNPLPSLLPQRHLRRHPLQQEHLHHWVQVLEKRKAALRAQTVETLRAKEAEAEVAEKPSWHSKYKEQVAKTEAKLSAAGPRGVFEPAGRRPAEESASDPTGGGELDEMD